MNVHILQHVPFEGAGSIAQWLVEHEATVTTTRFYDTRDLPAVAGLDLIIALGGPLSVNDEAAHPWLVEEKAFIREAIKEGVAVLGLCLGAQLIASALGKRVFPNAEREIGWFDIQAAPGADNVFKLPDVLTVFHWHGETFDLPEGAVRLAKSAGCQNQAFQLDRNVIGLQFHLETTPESVEAMIANCGYELTDGTFVQPAEMIRRRAPEDYACVNQVMADILSYLTSQSANG
ncbi:MAG TPA: type 1 glutamine amidotransferase [Verrucomicrobiales bacterium]|nr:type 1 glutamine amidotransferase [Verrucomicrobiales bacterium]